MNCPIPEVTDAMVDAAAAELRQVHGLAGLINNAAVRAAIEAALKAGCAHPRMGAWVACNFGADEVRICPDCDLTEKRRADASSAPSEVALVVLCAHQWDHLAQGCTCGWTQKRSLPSVSRQKNHPAHVVDVLRLVGVLS